MSKFLKEVLNIMKNIGHVENMGNDHNKIKILFLDIDGVLNTGDNLVSHQVINGIDPNYEITDKFATFFDERCVRYLKWIVKKTNCKIVISSTWKLSGLKFMQNLWEYRNLPGEVIDLTPTIVDQYIINMYGVVNDNADRGFEIQQWLEENKWDTYCIIDDDTDMLSSQIKNFVKCNPMHGITINEAEKVIKILNKTD
jgi:hypothetical protein